MTSFTFEVPGAPIPKARPRTVRTPSGKSTTFTPKQTRDFEALIGQLEGEEEK